MHEISGFMPARGEFDVEFENDAETSIREIVFEETDSKDERGNITIFNRVLVFYLTHLHLSLHSLHEYVTQFYQN
jgi:transcriptional adapter 2-alpha